MKLTQRITAGALVALAASVGTTAHAKGRKRYFGGRHSQSRGAVLRRLQQRCENGGRQSRREISMGGAAKHPGLDAGTDHRRS